MKLVIVDDEKPARDRLTRLLDRLPDYRLVGTAANGQEALNVVEQQAPDIVLMDIRMPGMDGLEASRQLMQQDNPPAVIFTTAFSDHALEAFETHAIDYLLKPVKIDRLEQALKACERTNRAQLKENLGDIETASARSHICARMRGNLQLIPLQDIFYFQAELKYVTVRYVGGEVLIEEPLKKLEQEFDGSFVRIHRNALVRIDKISGMKNSPEKHQIQFAEIDDLLEVSRRHLSGVRKLLKAL